MSSLELARCDLALSHWGAYEVDRTGSEPRLRPWRQDPDPSPVGLAMLDAYRNGPRVLRPAVRQGWLERRSRQGRGREPFVEVSWDEALALVAGELRDVISRRGNEAVFGGSYGWASAGRFHHAQSQLHRFLNVLGGYVRHSDSYSLGAGRVVLPHIVGDMDSVLHGQQSWDTLAEHTRLFLAFGGVPWKNAQVTAGGAMEHRARAGLARLAAAGCRIVNVSPVRDDLDGAAVEWVPIRPNTDTAALLALGHEIVVSGRADTGFLATRCEGFAQWRAYLLGEADGVAKSAAWAEAITGIPAATLRGLAHELASTRSLVNVSWSLQRADHGEQPYWACIGLTALTGQVGLAGGGFGIGYGATNLAGSRHPRIPGPTLAQGVNRVRAFIPCARIADMLLAPGATFRYDGGTFRYPDIELVYWAGGNPFHHHQDLHRLVRAWGKPRTIVVHEQVWNAHAKMADIVLPVTSNLERDDIGFAALEPLLVAMRAVAAPPGQAHDDHAIFVGLARLLGVEQAFTEGRTPREWLRHLYGEWAPRLLESGLAAPDFEAFWRAGALSLPPAQQPPVMLEDFRRDPAAHPLRTPSGRIELFSERVASFGQPDCPGHPAWLEPGEWLGAPAAREFPIHLLTDQPATKLHSQLDFSAHSLSRKVRGREPILLAAEDAVRRGIADGDVVRVFNRRGAFLAGAVVTSGVMPGVARVSTGAWWDPVDPGVVGSLDRHGNPNTLTRDAGASSLSQGCAAQSCLVEIERYTGELPATSAHRPPMLHRRQDAP